MVERSDTHRLLKLRFHTDHLGTPRAVTDSTGKVLWQWEGDIFGDVEPQIAEIKQPLRMAGQYHDAETGLFYNYFRYYDPKTGGYLRPDPIGLAGGMNPYVYVGGNPVMGVDPLGLWPTYVPMGPEAYDEFLNGMDLGITGYDKDGVPEYDKNHFRYHYYEVVNSCSKSEPWCTYDKLKNASLYHARPWASCKIENGSTTKIPTVGTVRHVIREDGTIVNITLDNNNHLLHSGTVSIKTIETSDRVYTYHIGEGTGLFGFPNLVLADFLWSSVYDDIIEHAKE